MDTDGTGDINELDLTDPDVFDLATRHKPVDVWDLGGQLVGVICEVCYQGWPCTTAHRVRATDEVPPGWFFSTDIVETPRQRRWGR